MLDVSYATSDCHSTWKNFFSVHGTLPHELKYIVNTVYRWLIGTLKLMCVVKNGVTTVSS